MAVKKVAKKLVDKAKSVRDKLDLTHDTKGKTAKKVHDTLFHKSPTDLLKKKKK